MSVFGSANFSRCNTDIFSVIDKSQSFDLSNFYGYCSNDLIVKGLRAEFIKFHPAAWFYSKNPKLWRICSIANNVCRHLKIFKPSFMLSREVKRIIKKFPTLTLALHDFNSTGYMTRKQLISFVKFLRNSADIEPHRIIICETEKMGCFTFENYIQKKFKTPNYYFGEGKFNCGVKILNPFYKKDYFE